jgi:hypothetical protein
MASLTQFNANLDTNQITLTFDVPITAIDPTQVYALSSSSDTNRNLTFAGSTVTGLNTTTLTLTIPAALVSLINASPSLWLSSSDTYILVNALSPSPTLGSNTTLLVTTYTGNPTVPAISSFTFQPGVNAPWNLKVNLNLASNIANAANIYVKANAITLQSTGSGGNTFTLSAVPTTTLLSTGYANTVLFKLNSNDLNTLNTSNICVGSGTTYLSVANTFINNRYGVNNSPRLSSNALLGTYVSGSNTAFPGYYSNSVGDLRLAGGNSGINNQAVITDGQANLTYQPVFTTAITFASGNTYTATYNDSVIACSNTANITVTLPAANALAIGRTFVIKDVAANASRPITVQVSGSDTIDGNSNITIPGSYGSATLICVSSSSWGQIV